MSITNCQIREMRIDEIYMLNDFLYEAIFQTDENNLLPREVILQPEISVYIDNFGGKDDYCFVADISGKVIGAVWVRILAGEVKGYGYIDSETPEFAISIFKEYRNMGIGRELMSRMIAHLSENGYKQTSLSVDRKNYAVKLYKEVGFEVIKEKEDDYLMVLNLNNNLYIE